MTFKKVRPLFTFISKLYFANILILVSAIVIGIFEYYSYTNLPDGYNPGDTVLPVEYISAGIAVPQMIIGIMLLVNFFRFIYRVSKNLQYQYDRKLMCKPGWSVGYFFIPVLNLFKPYRAVKEMYETACNEAPIDLKLMNTWWALWILSNMVGRIVIKYAIKNMGVYADTTETLIYLLSDSIDLILCGIEYKLVTKIGLAFIKNFENNEGTASIETR